MLATVSEAVATIQSTSSIYWLVTKPAKAAVLACDQQYFLWLYNDLGSYFFNERILQPFMKICLFSVG